MRTLLAAAIALAAASACASPKTPREGSADVAVELDAFSGRPNPAWTLSPAEAGELAVRLRALPRAGASRLPEPVLGYRGFRIRNPGGEGGVPEAVYVSRGGLIQPFGPGGEGTVYRDERRAEAWLISLARERG